MIKRTPEEILKEEWEKVTNIPFDETVEVHLRYVIKAMEKYAKQSQDQLSSDIPPADLRFACSISYHHAPHDGCDGRPHLERNPHYLKFPTQEDIESFSNEIGAGQGDYYESGQQLGRIEGANWVIEEIKKDIS